MSVDVLFSAMENALGAKVDNFRQPLAEALATYARTSNQLSQASVDKRAKDAFDTTDNAQVAEIRNRIAIAKQALEEANAQRAAAIEAIKGQLEDTLTDEQRKALRADRNSAKRTVIANLEGLAVISKFVDSDELREAAEAFHKEFDGKRSGSGGQGSGRPKARVENVHITHPSGQVVDESNFTKAAQRTKLDTGVLADGWYTAAGTQDWKEITSPVTYTVGEFSVTVTPKAQKAEPASADTAVAI